MPEGIEYLPVEKNAGSVLQTVLRILSRWDLTHDEQAVILGTSRDQLRSWQEFPPALASLPPDTVYRLSYVLGIYKALRTLYSDDGIADGWVKRLNAGSSFDGRPPLDRLLQGGLDDLKTVRRFLDGWCQ